RASPGSTRAARYPPCPAAHRRSFTIRDGRSPPVAVVDASRAGAVLDDAVLHDEANPFHRPDVLQRVAVDGDQVGALAGLDGAGLAVDAARLGAPARAGQERVEGWHAEPHQRGH